MLYVRRAVIRRSVSIVVIEILSNVLIWIVRFVFSPRTISGWNNLCRFYDKISPTTDTRKGEAYRKQRADPDTYEVISWPATMWGPTIVLVRVVRPSAYLSHANTSETKRDRRMVTRKLVIRASRFRICHQIRDRKYGSAILYVSGSFIWYTVP